MAECKDMDSLSLTLLQAMDDLVKSKVEMEKSMSEGFILMAKARMILGKERVSMMQFPTNDEERMTARYCVCRESSDEEILPLEQSLKTSLNLDAANDEDLTKSDSAMQLRHRKSDKKQHVARETDGADTSYSEEEQKRLVLLKKSEIEPLKWFGVLVPKELRLAQKAFENSISLSVKCANIQNRVEAIKEALNFLKAAEKGV